jgi:hypothetical protein
LKRGPWLASPRGCIAATPRTSSTRRATKPIVAGQSCRRTLGCRCVRESGDAIRVEREPTVAVKNPAATAPSGRPSCEAMAVSQVPHNIPALRPSRRR